MRHGALPNDRDTGHQTFRDNELSTAAGEHSSKRGPDSGARLIGAPAPPTRRGAHHEADREPPSGDAGDPPSGGAGEPASGGAGPNRADAIFHVNLPADLTCARHARSAIRNALATWGMDDLSGDAELLASELVTSAAQHAGGRPLSLALSRLHEPGGQTAIICEVTDTSPILPDGSRARRADERGRGLAIVTALSTTSGVRKEAAGRTSWFTLTLHHRIEPVAREAEPGDESEA